MIVCVCRRVSDRDIRAAARAGTGSFEELQLALGVATQCGCCEGCAREVFDAACAEAAVQRGGAVAASCSRSIATSIALP